MAAKKPKKKKSVGRPTKYKSEYCQAKFQTIKHEIIDGVELKWCPKCEEFFKLECFSLCSRTSDGLQWQCKSCEQQYRDAHKQEIKKRIKRWAIKNPERLNRSSKKWAKANPEKTKTIYKKNNQKRLSTPKGKLAKSMGDAVYKCLKRDKKGKCTFDVLPYTVSELKKHLENTMPDGYSWWDYITGKLHIDHIIPVSKHNFEKIKDEDFEKCWALSNLQLLPAFDNISKSNKLDKPFQSSFVFK